MIIGKWTGTHVRLERITNDGVIFLFIEQVAKTIEEARRLATSWIGTTEIIQWEL